MSQLQPCLRSPELMSPADTALVVIDVQEKLVPAIAANEEIVWNIRRLADAAAVLGVMIVATEQYPEGLGPTVAALAGRLGTPRTKLSFSCCACEGLFDALAAAGVSKLLLCGVEAHVCVQQTALDLLSGGWRVYVAADAVGSRSPRDCDVALRRMESAGAALVTTEAAMFEWCQAAGTPEFRQISRLVRQPRPTPGSE